jgi:hypothetical protein
MFWDSLGFRVSNEVVTLEMHFLINSYRLVRNIQKWRNTIIGNNGSLIKSVCLAKKPKS